MGIDKKYICENCNHQLFKIEENPNINVLWIICNNCNQVYAYELKTVAKDTISEKKEKK